MPGSAHPIYSPKGLVWLVRLGGRATHPVSVKGQGEVCTDVSPYPSANTDHCAVLSLGVWALWQFWPSLEEELHTLCISLGFIFYDTKVMVMNRVLNATVQRTADHAAPEITLDPLEIVGGTCPPHRWLFLLFLSRVERKEA